MSFSGRKNTPDDVMLKRILKILAFAVPVLILIVFLLKVRAPFGGNTTSFAIDPGKKITRIYLASGDKELTLEKRDENWFVNGTRETRKSSILFILRILNELQIKSPVTPELFNNEIVAKNIVPVKVKVYNRKLLRSFLVYKTNSNPYGNIMKLKEGAKPFIMYVPGNEVEIGSAFNLNELFWQPFTLFELMPYEISLVALENYREPETSFTLRKEGGDFILPDSKTDVGWDKSKVIRYVSYFTHIPFESWALDLSPEKIQEIVSGQPLYRLTVAGPDGKKTVLSLWEKVVTDEDGKTLDSDRLWGRTEGSDKIFVIRYIDIDPVLKKRSYFLGE
jgi:hypothetical protein